MTVYNHRRGEKSREDMVGVFKYLKGCQMEREVKLVLCEPKVRISIREWNAVGPALLGYEKAFWKVLSRGRASPRGGEFLSVEGCKMMVKATLSGAVPKWILVLGIVRGE